MFLYIEVHSLELSFFFSSRRRHTRWTGDWSSDVCSSDLGFGADPCDRGTAGGPDAAGSLSAARRVAGQVGHVADGADGRKRPGLPRTQAKPERRFDAAVDVEVLAAVARERLFGDAVEQLRAGEVGQADAGDRQPGELGSTRVPFRHSVGSFLITQSGSRSADTPRPL